MSYGAFLLYFIVPPILVLLWRGHRSSWLPISILSVVAFVYTTPWDNYLVYKGVWAYGFDRVMGVIGYVPIEEYLFFILQTWLTGLLFFEFAAGKNLKFEGASILGGLFWLLVSAFGFWCLYEDKTLYLGLILAWAGPVLMIQWSYGGRCFSNNLKLYLLAVGVPTFYLWVCDAIAIHNSVWEISEKYTLGIKLGGILPIEEAIFFLVTNLLVVQGLWLLSKRYGHTFGTR